MSINVSPRLWEWLYPCVDTVETRRKFGTQAVSEVRTMLGVVKASGRKARAEARAAEGARIGSWNVLVAQGVPLRDPDAVFHFARKWFAEKKKSGVYVYETDVSTEIRRLAGGTMPAGDALDRMRDLLNEHNRRRMEKGKYQPADPRQAFAKKRAAIYERMADTVHAQLVRERHFESRIGFTTGNASGVRVTCAEYVRPQFGLFMKYESRYRGRQTLSVEVAPSWYAQIFKRGRHLIAGPNTLARTIERTPRGEKITFYERKEKLHVIYLREGYLSFRNGTHVIVDIKTLAKVTPDGVKEV